jgi:flagellar hook-length control protein FliK
MNELLSIVNLPEIDAAPPGAIPKPESAKGDGGFAAMLMQLGPANPALASPGLTKNDTQQSVVSPDQLASITPTFQMTSELLQLLNSVGLTGQQPAMDGSTTGSLMQSANAQNLEQLLGKNADSQLVGKLFSVGQWVSQLAPATGDQKIVILPEQLLALENPSPQGPVDNVTQFSLPADLVLSSNDLAQVRAILAGVLTTAPGAAVATPELTTGVPAPVDLPKARSADETVSLEQALKTQFPTLKLEQISAQIELADPQLARPEAAKIPATNAKVFIADNPPVNIVVHDIAPLSELSKGTEPSPRLVDQRLPNALTNQNGQTAINVPDGNVTSPAAIIVAAETAKPAVEVPAQPVAQLAAAINSEDVANPKGQTDPVSAPRTPDQLEVGSLEKSAVKAVDTTADYSQTAQQWNNQAAEKNDASSAERVTETRQPHLEKTKFKIQFDRFQIDALLKRSEIKLQLQPASLGSMRVKLVSTPQEMTARFETTTEAARAAVEQSLPLLKESLEKAGIKVDHVEVVLDEQRTRQQQSQYHNRTKYQSDNEPAESSAAEPERSGGGGSSVGGSLLGGLNLLA